MFRYSLSLLLLLSACGSETWVRTPAKPATVVNQQATSLDQLGYYARAVALESHEDALLGSISDVKVDAATGDLLVADFKISKQVYRFNAEGRYLHS